jgi:type I restriction enzyme S subunit
VEWIGEIPEHWEVRRSKFLFEQRRERARVGDVQLSATQAYGVIPQEEYEGIIERRVVKIQFHLDKRKHVEIDDFVISMRSFQGGLERAWSSGCIRSSYVVLKPLQEIDASFYGYLFKSSKYITALQSTASFIRDGQDLNFENFSMVDLLIPPLDEQREISKFLNDQLVANNNAINVWKSQIEKLKEYKATLVNAAVTGKIKVC